VQQNAHVGLHVVVHVRERDMSVLVYTSLQGRLVSVRQETFCLTFTHDPHLIYNLLLLHCIIEHKNYDRYAQTCIS